MLSLYGAYVAGSVPGMDESWARLLHTCGVRLLPVEQADPALTQLLIAPQEQVNGLLPRFPRLEWVHLVDRGAELVDLEQIKARRLLLTDSSLIYHPGYLHDPFRCRDQLERNFRLWFSGERLQTVLWQPEP